MLKKNSLFTTSLHLSSQTRRFSQSLNKTIKKIVFSKENTKLIPETPGIYIFWNKDKIPLYVGKAINLKRRVSSYKSQNLLGKTKTLIKLTKYFSFIRVGSEIEALLLEANLVKKFKPQYNFSLKDDKNPLYIKITKEKYPRIITARKKDNEKDGTFFLGPFPSSSNVKTVLKIIRKVFPFSDHKLKKRACFYSQIGLCNPCPNVINNLNNRKLKAKYRKNIRLIKGILKGKINVIKNQLLNEMYKKAKDERFEEAIELRNKLQALEYITQPITPIKYFLKNPNLIEDIRKEELNNLKKLLSEFILIKNNLQTIECYDVAHISGKNPTASMVRFKNAEPDKNFYRHFKIRQEKGQDDLLSLNEVAKRREKHLVDWGKPDLIVVDGGKPQVRVFLNIFVKHKIPIVGVAKKTESLIIPKISRGKVTYKQYKIPKGPALYLIQRLRDEAHRFARKYHHKLFRKSLIPENNLHN